MATSILSPLFLYLTLVTTSHPNHIFYIFSLFLVLYPISFIPLERDDPSVILQVLYFSFLLLFHPQYLHPNPTLCTPQFFLIFLPSHYPRKIISLHLLTPVSSLPILFLTLPPLHLLLSSSYCFLYPLLSHFHFPRELPCLLSSSVTPESSKKLPLV